jgi:hypothetical protein
MAELLLLQVFYSLTAVIFNHLIKHRDTAGMLTATMGFHIKMNLVALEDWLRRTVTGLDAAALIPPLLSQLEPLREACNVLSMDKDIFASSDTVQRLFQCLSPLQIKTLLLSFQPDEFSRTPLSPLARRNLEIMCKQTGNGGQRLDGSMDAHKLLSLASIRGGPK